MRWLGTVVTLCCLTLLAGVHARQPGRPAQHAAGARTRRQGGGPSSAAPRHRRLDAEHQVRVFVYPPPVAPFREPYAWRFDPLIKDLKKMGVVTSNMSEAHAFLIVNHMDKPKPKGDDRVLT